MTSLHFASVGNLKRHCGLLWVLLALAVFIPVVRAEDAAVAGLKILKDRPYKTGDALTDYEKERCKLDVYLPEGKTNFATLVWFHGGGLIAGRKDEPFTLPIVRSLSQAGIAVVVPNYRLSPKVTFPAYVDDAAAAVAWTKAHIGELGGDPARVFVGGHSAGGYLAALLVMDVRYLEKYAVDVNSLAGFIPVSGQMVTHYTIREEQKIPKYHITSDDAAPIHYSRSDTPPMLVLYADRDMETRKEENEYFVAVMRAAKNKQLTNRLLTDRTHGSIAQKLADPTDPGRTLILDFMATHTAAR